jgi:hypothetical protein
LVDNGIVIAEDIERRLAAGEDRKQACLEAGRTLALPLLTSSLVIVIAFSPFFFGQSATSEYLRSRHCPRAHVTRILAVVSDRHSTAVLPLHQSASSTGE